MLLVTLLFTSTHRVCDSTGCFHVGDDRLPAVIALVVGAIQTAFLVIIAQMCQTLGRVVDRIDG